MTFQATEPPIIYPSAYFSVRWMDDRNNPHEATFHTEAEATKFIENNFIISSGIRLYLAMPTLEKVFLFRRNRIETIE